MFGGSNIISYICNMKNIFNYNGNDITFINHEGSVMVNATEMIKSFEGKRINNYLRADSTLEYAKVVARKHYGDTETLNSVSLTINELSENYPKILKVVKGGAGGQGTWMHEDLALDFSQWLSPEFKLWCNDRIKELLKHGMTATDNVIDQILNNPDFGIELLTKLKEERQARIEAEKTNTILMHTNKTYTMTEIAKELNLRSAIQLNNILSELKIQYKMNNTWVMYSQYSNCGYEIIKQEVLDNGRVVYHRRITQLGRKFFLEKVGNYLNENQQVISL